MQINPTIRPLAPIPATGAQRAFDAALAGHRDAVDRLAAAVREPFGTLVDLCADAVRRGGKLILFGNGGSAGDAQHIATELVVRFRRDRPAIAALALTTDTSAITAIGNDLGFDELFARQIAALGRPGDVAIGISTSGASENVLRGLHAARASGLACAALAGKDGGRLHGIADPLLIAPSSDTAHIQEMHILIGHALCAALEDELGYA